MLLANGLASAHTPAAAGVPSLKQLAALTDSTSGGVNSAHGQAQGTSSEVSSAIAALQSMTSGKSDPHYASTLAALEHAQSSAGGTSSTIGGTTGTASEAAKLAATVAEQGTFLANVLGELSTGASKLQAGIAKLRAGNVQLAGGIDQLSKGGGQLTSGLTQLRDGAGALETGLGQLTNGAGQLQAGLAGGVSPTGQLVNGLGQLQAGVTKFTTTLPSPKQIEELNEQAPGLFNSGYFLLAAVEGAQPASANAATFAVNVARGGSAGQVVVISRYDSSDPRTAALGDRLDAAAKQFAIKNHLATAVGGPAGNLADFTSATNERLPLVIIALALAVALTLGIALRAVALPIAAVLMLLLTAASTFGAMELLFGGSHPPLGGPGYLDPMSIIGIFSVIFGVSLVYLVVLLARTREEIVKGRRRRRGARHGASQDRGGEHGLGALDDRRADPLRHHRTDDRAHVRRGHGDRHRPRRVPRAPSAAARGGRGDGTVELVADACLRCRVRPTTDGKAATRPDGRAGAPA